MTEEHNHKHVSPTRSSRSLALIASAVRGWIAAVPPGKPMEDSDIQSLNARLRDRLLDGEIFFKLKEAGIIVENWHRYYNTVRPQGSLGYKPPAPEVFIPEFTRAASPTN